MIVSEVMTSRVITVTPDDTLSHAANLLRQYQFHHLPVVRTVDAAKAEEGERGTRKTVQLLEGLLTSEDINMAAAVGSMSSSEVLHRPWQEKHVAEVMHRAPMCVTPTTSAAAAAQILVERGLSCLPVVEYERTGEALGTGEQETRAILIGLLTRSDLLLALARALGAFEPGTQLTIPLPLGDLAPLAKALLLAKELHIQVRSVMAAPLEGSMPLSATLRLGTINPTPLLLRLQEAHIQCAFADSPTDPR